MSLPVEALVLAAGEGRRLRPATEACPKPLVPFLNVPLLEHVLRRLAAAGVERAWINAWHRAERLVDFASRVDVPGLDVRVVVESELLGTGGGLANLARHAEGECLLVLAGDILADFDLQAFARHHRSVGALASMALTPHPAPADYGAVSCDADHRLIEIAGLLDRDPGDAPAYVNASAHLLQREFLERLPRGPSCLVRQGYVPVMAAGLTCSGWIHPGRWDETGTPAALTAAQSRALDGHAPVDAELLARGGRLARGPSLVSAEARVASDAVLEGGTTVASGAEVGAGARLKSCLVMEGARVPAGEQLAHAVVSRRGIAR